MLVLEDIFFKHGLSHNVANFKIKNKLDGYAAINYNHVAAASIKATK